MTYAEIKGTVHCDFPQKLIDICFEYGISIVKSEVSTNEYYIHVTDKNTEVACNVFMSDIQRFLSVYKVINLDAVQEAIKLNDYTKKGFTQLI